MPYYRISIEGGYNSNPEVWASGFAVAVDGPPPSQAAIDGYAEACMLYLSGASTDAQSLRATLSIAGEIRRVRVYYHSAPNTVASMLGVSVAPLVTGTGTITLPLQTARVVTLLTGTPGASFRGRMYWPKVTTGQSSTGTDTSLNQPWATNFALSLRTMAQIAPSTSAGQPAVVSLTKGLITPVIRIRVGNVVDTQRRRRDNITETFFNAVIP